MFFVCALKEPASDWNKLAVAGSDPDLSFTSSFKVEVDYMSKPRSGGAVVTHASFDSTSGGGFDCEKSFTAFTPDTVSNTYFLLIRLYRGNTESTPRLRFIGLRSSATTYPATCP